MCHTSAAKATEGFPITRVLHVFAPGLEHQTVSLPRGNNWQQPPATLTLQPLQNLWISAPPSVEQNKIETFYKWCLLLVLRRKKWNVLLYLSKWNGTQGAEEKQITSGIREERPSPKWQNHNDWCFSVITVWSDFSNKIPERFCTELNQFPEGPLLCATLHKVAT